MDGQPNDEAEVFVDAADEFQPPSSGSISPKEESSGHAHDETADNADETEEDSKLSSEELKALRKERKKAKLAAKKLLKQQQQQEEEQPQEDTLIKETATAAPTSSEATKSKKKRSKKSKGKGSAAVDSEEGSGEDGEAVAPPIPPQVSTKSKRTSSPSSQDDKGNTTPAPATPVRATNGPSVDLALSPSKTEVKPPHLAPPPPLSVDMVRDFSPEPLAHTSLASQPYPPIFPPAPPSPGGVDLVEESLVVHGPWIKSQIYKQDCKGEDKSLMSTGHTWTMGGGQEGGPSSSPPPSTAFSAFGVFDGHGGKQAANWCSKTLLPVICKHLDRCRGSDSEIHTDPDSDPRDSNKEIEAVRSRARSTWAAQEGLIERLPKSMHAGFLEGNETCIKQLKESGTTATLAVVVGWEVIVASVGDSTAFLDTGSEIIQVSANHRVDESAEDREKVIAKGGSIAQSDIDGVAAGPLRIWPGGLMMTRTIGDPSAEDYCPADPDVRQVTLPAGGARLIMASDGLWDACNAKAMIGNLRKLPTTQAASTACHNALKKRGLVDDITVLVIDFCTSPDDKIPASLLNPSHAHAAKGGSTSSSSVQILRPLESHVGAVWRSGMIQRREEILLKRLRRANEREAEVARLRAEAEAQRAAEEAERAAEEAEALALAQAEAEAEALRARAEAEAEAVAAEERRLKAERVKSQRTKAPREPRQHQQAQQQGQVGGQVGGPHSYQQGRQGPPRQSLEADTHPSLDTRPPPRMRERRDRVRPPRPSPPSQDQPLMAQPLDPHVAQPEIRVGGYPSQLRNEAHETVNETNAGAGGGGRGRVRLEGGRGRGRAPNSYPNSYPNNVQREGQGGVIAPILSTPPMDNPPPSLPPSLPHAASEAPGSAPNMGHHHDGRGRVRGRGGKRGESGPHENPNPRQVPIPRYPSQGEGGGRGGRGGRGPMAPYQPQNPRPHQGVPSGGNEVEGQALNWQQQQQQQQGPNGFGADFGSGFGGRGGGRGGRHFNAGGRGGGRKVGPSASPPLP